ELGEKVTARRQPGKRALADAEKLQVDLPGVDADNGNAAPHGGRQDEVVAGEADRGFAVAHIDVENDRAFQHFAYGGGQTGAQGDAVALAVLKPFDADLPVLGLHRRGRISVHADEGGVVDAGAHEVFGKLDAGARRKRVGIDRIVDYAKALARLEIRVGCAHLRIVGDLETCLVGLERGAP